MSKCADPVAANDARFQRVRHRTLAIPETVTPVAHYPSKLRIYQTNASPYWQVRTFLQGKTYTQSLRTTHRAVALRGARDFFHRKVAEIYGQRVTERADGGVRFQDLVKATLAHEHARAERGELTQSGLRILQRASHRYRLPSLAHYWVGAVAQICIGAHTSDVYFARRNKLRA